VRRFVVGFALLCLCALSAGILYAPALASTSGHGCAYPVPPGIPGSPAPAPAVSGVVVFNEVLLAPHSTWNCSESNGTYFVASDSWIEFYNTQNEPYNLYAARAYLDSGPNTNQFYLPFGASIAAHGYLVIFPYLNNSDFLMTKTPTFRLVISNVVIDQVAVPALGPDQSYARTVDGGPAWEITSTPTIDASNTSLITPTAGALPGTPAATQVIASGTQPAWKKLLMPTPTAQLVLISSPIPTTTTPSQANSISPTASSSLTFTQQIILTALIIALGATLYAGWRLFGPEKKR
jgi:hypothetical protein